MHMHMHTHMHTNMHMNMHMNVTWREMESRGTIALTRPLVPLSMTMVIICPGKISPTCANAGGLASIVTARWKQNGWQVSQEAIHVPHRTCHMHMHMTPHLL